ncbi:MAG: hypothetical protein RLZZ387_1507 [Chloroflexota bacterium]|jgi:hypothetical protein
MIPKITRDELSAVLVRFDAELRDTDEWHDWEGNKGHKWAIAHGGRRYPIKLAVALAAGVLPATFSGGEGLNARIARMGFSVVRLEDRPHPTPAPAPEVAELQSQLYDLEMCLQEAKQFALTEQARLHLALAALAALRSHARHAPDCPISPCACGYSAADAHAAQVEGIDSDNPF